VDLQFGSTGKGLIAGYLSQRKAFDTVVSANMPNAGHTFVDSNGIAWVNKVLPSGLYGASTTYVGLGPGAIFDPLQLAQEIDGMRSAMKGIPSDPTIIIHECAALLHEDHRIAEKKLNPIASTMQGSSEAMVQKIRRDVIGSNICGQSLEYLDKIITSRGEKLSKFVVSNQQWMDIMLASDNILVEGSQGYSLGINAGFYPYCTSRDCTIHRLIADCGIPVLNNKTIIGTARVHPIRVGNTEGGHSGSVYPDQLEISWASIGVAPELTTVTKRVRRVFTFSEAQIYEALMMNGPDYVFMNFCNYDVAEAIRVSNVINKIGREVHSRRGLGNALILDDYPPLVRYMGFGPRAEDVMEVNHYY